MQFKEGNTKIIQSCSVKPFYGEINLNDNTIKKIKKGEEISLCRTKKNDENEYLKRKE